MVANNRQATTIDSYAVNSMDLGVLINYILAIQDESAPGSLYITLFKDVIGKYHAKTAHAAVKKGEAKNAQVTDFGI